MLRRSSLHHHNQPQYRVLRAALCGAPFSGKGTMSKWLIRDFGFRHFSTGDELRVHIRDQTELGKKIAPIIAHGGLISDDIIIDIVHQKFTLDPRFNGTQSNLDGGAVGEKNTDCQIIKTLLDGFPRTIGQAKALEEKEHLALDLVLNIDVPDEEIIERVCHRRIHPGSGRSYHLTWNPPKNEGVDDETGEPLIQRPDDTLEAIQKRLDVYHNTTKPLIDFWAKKGIVKTFTGRESKKIYPEMEKYLKEEFFVKF